MTRISCETPVHNVVMTEKVERNSIQFKGGEGGEKKKKILKKKEKINKLALNRHKNGHNVFGLAYAVGLLSFCP